MASSTTSPKPIRPTTRKGWGPKRDGKYQYKAPTRLWEFDPSGDHALPLVSIFKHKDGYLGPGTWRYRHRGDFWVDWKPNNWATKLLLKDEELPPRQYQTMREIQKYNKRRKMELEQEKLRKFRQARLDLEREAKEERERVANKVGEKKNLHQQQEEVTEIDQPAHDKSPKKSTRVIKRFTSKVKHCLKSIKKAVASKSAAPRVIQATEFLVAPEDEPLRLRSEAFRKRLSLMELEIEDDCRGKMAELEYILWVSVPADMVLGAPEV
ncbi:hypothetical protein N0V93_008700 [Gnomoniopsis smithogilvyi]|uniref:Uncharacterized protein n=1 Tax=Gnomoniopsis smithogilvyi TaxID=1191159 RepID=A0A9W9CTY1_9PEZI|nr:hypothetical protein N0V93_008700 [Gnomoniopsis smithogilvyi]